MKDLKDYSKKTLCLLSFAIVLTAFTVFSLVTFYVMDLSECARLEYSGVIINMRSRLEPADLEEMGIPSDSVENVTDDTFKMNLIIDELDFEEELYISIWSSSGKDFVSNKLEKDRIIIDYNYAFNLTFIVNSSDPSIQNIKFFNTTNNLNGHFSIDTEHNLNVSTLFGYEITGNNSTGVSINIPYHFSLYFGAYEEFNYD
jgi:hypothetical protein